MSTKNVVTTTKNQSTTTIKKEASAMSNSTIAIKHKYELVSEPLAIRHYEYKVERPDPKGKTISTLTKTEEFPLQKISSEELLEKRMYRKKAGFVLKNGADLFYTAMPKKTNLIGSPIFENMPHMCGHSTNCPQGGCCSNLSVSACSKIACRSLQFYTNHGVDFKEAVVKCGRIEKFDFIHLGYEIFNNSSPFICVLKCSNYEDVPKPEKLSAKEAAEKSQKAKESKLHLAQFVWPDVTSRAEVLDLIHQNEIKSKEAKSKGA